MNTINISSIEPINESTAVAIGKAIVAAELPVRLSEEVWSLGEDQYSELEQYLERRGVVIKGNDSSEMIADRR